VPPVPVGRTLAGRSLADGVLADVAPPLLDVAGLPRWEGMTGHSLLGPRDPVVGSPVVASGAVRTEVPDS